MPPSYKYLGHNLSEEEIEKNIDNHWEIYKNFLFPKFIIKCPICGSEKVILKQERFFRRDEGRMKYRCDIAFKCSECSNVWWFGVVIPDDLGKKQMIGNNSATYYWREIKEKVGGENG